jgi:hypothetical protein
VLLILTAAITRGLEYEPHKCKLFEKKIKKEVTSP